MYQILELTVIGSERRSGQPHQVTNAVETTIVRPSIRGPLSPGELAFCNYKFVLVSSHRMFPSTTTSEDTTPDNTALESVTALCAIIMARSKLLSIDISKGFSLSQS